MMMAWLKMKGPGFLPKATSMSCRERFILSRLRRKTTHNHLSYVLAHLEEVVSGLHYEPCFGCAAYRFFEARGHREDAARAIDDPIEP